MRCIDGDKHAYCLLCGTLIGFLSDGTTPYRIRFTRIIKVLEHHERAFAWLTEIAFEAGYRGAVKYSGEPQDRAILREALTATKEANHMTDKQMETTMRKHDAPHEQQEQWCKCSDAIESAADFLHEYNEHSCDSLCVDKLEAVLEQAKAECDHLRRALEWLGGHVDRTNKDCPPEPYNDEDPTPEFPQEKAPEGTVCWDVALECVRCWCRAALAATNEAT